MFLQIQWSLFCQVFFSDFNVSSFLLLTAFDKVITFISTLFLKTDIKLDNIFCEVAGYFSLLPLLGIVHLLEKLFLRPTLFFWLTAPHPPTTCPNVAQVLNSPIADRVKTSLRKLMNFQYYFFIRIWGSYISNQSEIQITFCEKKGLT